MTLAFLCTARTSVLIRAPVSSETCKAYRRAIFVIVMHGPKEFFLVLTQEQKCITWVLSYLCKLLEPPISLVTQGAKVQGNVSLWRCELRVV